MSGGACIVGIGQTKYRRRGGHSDRSEFQLACEAVVAAAADAGISTHDLDGLASFAEPSFDVALLQQALGMSDLRFSGTVWGGRGGSACAAVALAADAVQTGRAKTVAVVRSLCQGRGRRYGQVHPGRTHNNFTAPFGLFSAPQLMALALSRYDHQYGLDPAAMMEVALVCRENANANSCAVMHGVPLTRDDYCGGRRIADPLNVFDCCLETDGACAVLVTTQERARDLRGAPVEIVAAELRGEPGWTTGYMGSHNVPSAAYGTGGQTALARAIYAAAGVGPVDIDVVQFYDHFTGMVLLALEDFEFCERGESSRFVRNGGLRRGGALPINTAGGNLSEAYVHGLNHVVEGVRQIRGDSTAQVSQAELCLVTSGSGMMPSSALILGRVP